MSERIVVHDILDAHSLESILGESFELPAHARFLTSILTEEGHGVYGFYTRPWQPGTEHLGAGYIEIREPYRGKRLGTVLFTAHADWLHEQGFYAIPIIAHNPRIGRIVRRYATERRARLKVSKHDRYETYTLFFTTVREDR